MLGENESCECCAKKKMNRRHTIIKFSVQKSTNELNYF